MVYLTTDGNIGLAKKFLWVFLLHPTERPMIFLANPINGCFAFKNPIPSLSTSALQDLWVLPLECSCAGLVVSSLSAPLPTLSPCTCPVALACHRSLLAAHEC